MFFFVVVIKLLSCVEPIDEITEENFSNRILGSQKGLEIEIFHFSTTWCFPARGSYPQQGTAARAALSKSKLCPVVVFCVCSDTAREG